MINFIPIPVFTAIDEDGVPMVGAKLYTYATGTTTPKATYTDVTKATPNTNPIILDDNGQANIWIDADDGAYRFVLKTAEDVTLWTQDGIVAPGGEVAAVLTVAGDMLYASAAGTLSRLAKGTARQVLQMNAAGTYPNWVSSPNSILTTKGDLLIASAANVIARLGVGTALQVLQTNAGADAPEWAESPQSVLAVKGDILYASAANTLAKLAIGSANHKLFVNAAGDLPEWSASVKIGNFQRGHDASSGDQAITGVGFKPSIVIFLACFSGTSEMSIGFDDGVNCGVVYNAHGAAANTWSCHFGAIQSIYMVEGAALLYYGKISSLDADGFTITWTRSGATAAGTFDIYYLALR